MECGVWTASTLNLGVRSHLLYGHCQDGLLLPVLLPNATVVSAPSYLSFWFSSIWLIFEHRGLDFLHDYILDLHIATLVGIGHEINPDVLTNNAANDKSLPRYLTLRDCTKGYNPGSLLTFFVALPVIRELYPAFYPLLVFLRSITLCFTE